LFNFLAVALGFGMLVTSDVVALNRFGAIIMLAVFTAFVLSLTLIPAMVKVFRPGFVFGGQARSPRLAVAPLLAVSALLLMPADASGSTWEEALALDGQQAMQQVDARDDGDFFSRKLRMELTDRRGRTRVRETIGYRKKYADHKRTVTFFVPPTNVKDTGFLTWDYQDATADDDQWLYLPAVRKIRRISSADRGDYFLGTDFTFEDIKREGKGNLEDFTQKRIGEGAVNGVRCILIESYPVDKATAKDFGYGKIVSCINPINWMIVKSDFSDVKLNPLKTLTQVRAEEIDGIWTAMELHIENHKTGHQTRFLFSDINYNALVDETLLETRRLSRGL
jgi:hypothetical protein